jgi:large subunit ribosomal protein L24
MKLRKGDEVIITTGKDKGKRGKIEKILVSGTKVFLPGLNVYKKHVKKQAEDKPGGIIDLPRPLPIGNVALICPKCGKPTRIGFKVDGRKMRICKKCGSAL